MLHESSKKQQFRKKSNSLKQKFSDKMTKIFGQEEFMYLSPLANTKRRLNNSNQNNLVLDKLIEYIEEVVQKSYQNDLIGFQLKFSKYLSNKFMQDRIKIQERINLMKYQEDNIKYLPITEIDTYIQKEWRKNLLLLELNNIWFSCIATQHFENDTYFLDQYKKYRIIITNISLYYFKNALTQVSKKGSSVSVYLFEDSSHRIIQNNEKWNEVYRDHLLQFLRQRDVQNEEQLNYEFDLSKLKVNKQYLNIFDKENALIETTQIIALFAKQTKIHNKIFLLKEIRRSFLKEIEANSDRICRQQKINHRSTLEKDDIIDCMIYCIIKGQITNLQKSLKALALLLTPESQLLSIKGVDSYRADLQCAVQFIKQNQHQSVLIKQDRSNINKIKVK